MGVRLIRATFKNLAVAAALLLAVHPAAAQAVELEYLAGTEISGDLEVDGRTVGGLSALTWDPGCDLYYAVSDDRGAPGFYTLRISLSRATASVEVLESTQGLLGRRRMGGRRAVPADGAAA